MTFIKYFCSGLQSSDWDRDHAKNYIDYIDSTFTSEGHLPNMAEADEVFTPVNPDESLNFNESRLSLGLGRLSMGSVGSNNYDGMRLVTRYVVNYYNYSFHQDYNILFKTKHWSCERL